MNLRNNSSFTLIELLVVIAILAVLSTAVVLVLNPAELVKASRDATRLADLQSINKSLGLLQADIPSLNLGNATTVSISIPDSSPTCANLGLPTLPTGYGYRCVTATNLRRVDGTGWIPVNFTQFSSGAVLATLPIDPVNTTSSGNYYTYIPGGSWHLATSLEAAKNKMGGSSDKVSTDKGKFPSLYEVGTSLTLLPIEFGDTGLVGYWSMDEGGTATTTADASGKGNVGTLTNGPVWLEATNCKIGRCLDFDGVNDYVNATGNLSALNAREAMTVAYWAKLQSCPSGNPGAVGQAGIFIERLSEGCGGAGSTFYAYGDGGSRGFSSSALTLNNWYFIVHTYDKNLPGQRVYINGVLVTNDGTNIGNLYGGNPVVIGVSYASGYADAVIDEVRMYNRALSAAEILTLYNQGK